ncbi:MAG: histidine kinase [Rhodobacteraceae bacterium]|nr:histidine kinase [Paracoccaceae bacterium]
MNGKIVAGSIVAAAFLGGFGMYYLQVYAYYEQLDAVELRLTVAEGDALEPLAASDVDAIDADSSPLRFRACFVTPEPVEKLARTYATYPRPEPLTAPGWFDCYDAVAIGEALERGEAQAFMSQENIHDGVDRVIAVFPDGRGYAWHQLNEKFRD